ncbi:DUF3021 domain-containing protein [Bifidobacterium sp. ESL0763]|uniref:DUF3021 domain-containing protein n=1 Tax=Bifidobacterium sp. ESL0763 TaxID=2983227 RepID=UPI0023F79A4F|nr:DUF3021 domain-containing protein [Bifidobacterium sp. ESL0763]MDF7663174.1 DUF3021 domain-containing protein [Bifidobacterium sp. ESL0763]
MSQHEFPVVNAERGGEPTRPSGLLRAVIRNAVVGLGLGSFFFLLVEAVSPGWIPVTTMSVATFFVMTALIGELTFLLGNGRLPNYIAHCALTFALVVIWILANGWNVSMPVVFVVFVAIYAAIWVLIIARNKFDARKINEKLVRR